jgi:hypothetical protein
VPLRAESPAWNIYAPKWAPVTLVGGDDGGDGGDEVRLEARDPYDYAMATRVLDGRRKATLTFDVLAEQADAPLHVEVIGPSSPLRMAATPTVVGEWRPMRIAAEQLDRVVFRTGAPRGIGGANPVPPGTDKPHPPVAFRVRGLRVTG